MSRVIHTVDLREQVLHARLEMFRGVDVAKVLALGPGKFHMQTDVWSYPQWSGDQALLSLAKVNYKRVLLACCRQWRRLGVELDLTISLNVPMGRRRCMLASTPEWQAQRLEKLFRMCVGGSGVYDLWSEDFDPWVVVGRERWLFELIATELNSDALLTEAVL